MTYKIKLDMYEGPLDLLLYLIKKEEVDIINIPVAKITNQYLEYVQIMRTLNLDMAGEFIVMASTLIRIKARMLIPKNEVEDELIDDPREELMRNLLEYQEYKKIAFDLSGMQESQREVFYRSLVPEEIIEDADKEEVLEVSLFDLLTAFQDVLKNASEEDAFHEIELTNVNLQERITYLYDFLKTNRTVRFNEVFKPGTAKIVLVVTFIAMLELIKTQKITVGQSDSFGEILLMIKDTPQKNMPSDE